MLIAEGRVEDVLIASCNVMGGGEARPSGRARAACKAAAGPFIGCSGPPSSHPLLRFRLPAASPAAPSAPSRFSATRALMLATAAATAASSSSCRTGSAGKGGASSGGGGGGGAGASAAAAAAATPSARSSSKRPRAALDGCSVSSSRWVFCGIRLRLRLGERRRLSRRSRSRSRDCSLSRCRRPLPALLLRLLPLLRLRLRRASSLESSALLLDVPGAMAGSKIDLCLYIHDVNMCNDGPNP
mmetsp:Transcript_90861/g.189964  ORF Transcript_90861/g.189964 Transcript_90861/m.189964 type:complete len:243 (-) Transcript_90861:22-750(-)